MVKSNLTDPWREQGLFRGTNPCAADWPEKKRLSPILAAEPAKAQLFGSALLTSFESPDTDTALPRALPQSSQSDPPPNPSTPLSRRSAMQSRCYPRVRAFPVQSKSAGPAPSNSSCRLSPGHNSQSLPLLF